jgi:hypothetical protein
MKLFRQANADHPTPRAFHQRKASDDRSKGDPDNQASNGSKRDGHGDTTSNRTKRTIMLMATEPQIILRLAIKGTPPTRMHEEKDRWALLGFVKP